MQRNIHNYTGNGHLTIILFIIVFFKLGKKEKLSIKTVHNMNEE